MIDGQNVFDQLVKSNMRTYDNISTIATGQEDNYTCFLLNYPYFKERLRLLVIDFTKQKALDADPKAIRHVNFIGNLARDGNTTMLFNTKEVKDTILDFSQGVVRVLKFYLALIYLILI